MKILFLGTGAADWPLFRDDEMTEYRRMSAALIDDSLLIDPGPHVLEAMTEYGKRLSRVRYIINTHRHSDHFSERTLATFEALGAVFYDFSAGDEKKLGEYTIKAIEGNHDTCEKTLHFIISNGVSSLFYGLDGAWLLYDEFQAIKEAKPELAVLDGTIGFSSGDYRIFEHNDLNMVIEMTKTLSPYVKQFCISHMARTLHTDHETLCNALSTDGILVAFDGLELTI